jgi:hypothetical protein
VLGWGGRGRKTIASALSGLVFRPLWPSHRVISSRPEGRFLERGVNSGAGSKDCSVVYIKLDRLVRPLRHSCRVSMAEVYVAERMGERGDPWGVPTRQGR